MMSWKQILMAAPLLAMTLTVPLQARDHDHWRKHSEKEWRRRAERENRYRYNNGRYNDGRYNNYRALPPGLDRNRNGVDDRVERQQYRRNNGYYNPYNSPYYNR